MSQECLKAFDERLIKKCSEGSITIEQLYDLHEKALRAVSHCDTKDDSDTTLFLLQVITELLTENKTLDERLNQQSVVNERIGQELTNAKTVNTSSTAGYKKRINQLEEKIRVLTLQLELANKKASQNSSNLPSEWPDRSPYWWERPFLFKSFPKDPNDVMLWLKNY